MNDEEREPQSSPDGDAPLLFCPFCKECYEGIAACPEHELALVSFEALPRDPEHDALPGDDERLVGFDPRFGRGIVALGVVLLVGAFAAPMIEVTSATQSRMFSAYAAALTNAPNLWTIPFVAAMFVAFLLRRRTPAELRSARAAGAALALTPFVSMAYSWYRVTTGSAALREQSGQLIEVHAHWGFAMTSLACVVLLVGSLRMGLYPKGASRGLPSADPELEARYERDLSEALAAQADDRRDAEDPEEGQRSQAAEPQDKKSRRRKRR